MKMKKSAIVAVMSGAALFVGGAAATMASADTPGVNIGNNSCIAPWHWIGPGIVGTSGQTSSYSACTGSSSATTESGLGLLNNACVLPWNWIGPLNGMNTASTSSYVACEG